MLSLLLAVAAALLLPIAQGLEHMHLNNILHRDIKMSNLLRTSAIGEDAVSSTGELMLMPILRTGVVLSFCSWTFVRSSAS